MSKVLNLDQIVPENSTVILGGKEYNVLPPSVETLIKIMRVYDSIRDNDNQEQVIREIPKIVELIVPELKGKQLSIQQFKGLIIFISNNIAPDNSGEIEKAQAEPTKKGGLE